MRLTNEAEYDAAMALVDAVNRMCFEMLTASWKITNSLCMVDPKLEFYCTRNIRYRQIWDMACAAWEHINGEDAAEAAEQCAEYRANPRFNPDPSGDFKNSLPY